jgi:hypothetical protein
LSHIWQHEHCCRCSIPRPAEHCLGTPAWNYPAPLYTPLIDAGGNPDLILLIAMARHPTQAPWSCECLEYEQSIALGTVLEPASHASYSSALQSYMDFCTHHNFPFNPTPDTLSLYVVYMCHHLKPKSILSYLSGICNCPQPIYPDVRNNCKHKLVVNMLCRSTRLHAVATSHKHTITRKELNIACHQLKPCHTHDQKLFLAILLTSFHGLMCLGELTWPDKLALQDYRKVTL